jgi:hypothetical protein
MMLNSSITDEQLEKFKLSFMEDNVNQENSYLVSYYSGVFTILLGNPSENFHLTFEEYKEKMNAKYGVPDYDFIIEE